MNHFLLHFLKIKYPIIKTPKIMLKTLTYSRMKVSIPSWKKLIKEAIKKKRNPLLNIEAIMNFLKSR